MLNVLVAYPYFTPELVEMLLRERRDPRGIRFRLMVDSGAFTAWNTGTEIKLEDYCRFLDGIECLRPFHAVQLDVFGDHRRTRANYDKMRARGYDVMPVFTRGESLENLEKMYELTDYVMFGGITTGRQNAGYVKWFMDNLGPGRKIHWLGFTQLNFIKRYHPTSVDSSSCLSAGRYGGLHLYVGGGKFRRLAKADFKTRPPLSMVRLLLSHGVRASEVRDLSREESYHGMAISPLQRATSSTKGFVNFLNLVAFILQSQDVEHHTQTRFYHAVPANYARALLDAAVFLRERGVTT